MRWAIIIVVPFILTATGCTAPQKSTPLTQTPMEITSPAFQHNEMIPSKYSLDSINDKNE